VPDAPAELCTIAGQLISPFGFADFRETAAVYEFYSLHPRRVVYRTCEVSDIMNSGNND